jgi:hypothetical protein
MNGSHSNRDKMGKTTFDTYFFNLSYEQWMAQT